MTLAVEIILNNQSIRFYGLRVPTRQFTYFSYWDIMNHGELRPPTQPLLYILFFFSFFFINSPSAFPKSICYFNVANPLNELGHNFIIKIEPITEFCIRREYFPLTIILNLIYVLYRTKRHVEQNVIEPQFNL